jgi:DNA-binding transcriptional LysR family regulator
LWPSIAFASHSRRLAAAQKKLVPLLRDYKLDPVAIHAVFPGVPRPSAKVRAFVDFLAERLKKSGSAEIPRARSG